VSRKLALLVGVDRYPLLKPVNQLRSCANDARLMAHVLLERFSFDEEGLTLLLDEAATREGIFAGLQDLQARAKAGDSIVFFYSGHGSQVPEGEGGDEPDGLDETLVPHDSGRSPHPNRDVTDDEIYDWILEVNAITPYLTVIADTCFAGTLTRAPRPGEKWVEPDSRRPEARRPRPARPRSALHRRRDTGTSGFLPISDRYALLAACRVHEHAKELPPIPGVREPYSAFTFFLCQELLRAPVDATYRDVIERTRVAVAAAVAAQTPQLEGARDRLLFGIRRVEPARYLPLEARNGTRVRLGGGAVHGVDAGSQWGIYPPGTRQTKGAKPLAVVRVSEVRAVSAEAEIVKEKSPVQPGARAFEMSKGPGWMRLAVAVEADLSRAAAADLGRRIRRSKLLRLVEDMDQAEARVLMVDPPGGEGEMERQPPDSVRVQQKSWAVLGRTGELLLSPIPLRQPGSLVRLADDLEMHARYLNLLRLTDEDNQNPLRGCLEVHLLRRSANGDFRPAGPEKATGEVVYREGDYLALRVLHRAERPLHIHVLDLGLAGAIGLFHPVAGDNEPLLPGRALDIGVRAGQRIKMQIPEAFAAWSRASGNDGDLEGREFLKILATTEETDLSVLRQSGFRNAPAGKRPRGELGSLLCRALRGATREGASPVSGQQEQWTMATQAFLVRGSRR